MKIKQVLLLLFGMTASGMAKMRGIKFLPSAEIWASFHIGLDGYRSEKQWEAVVIEFPTPRPDHRTDRRCIAELCRTLAVHVFPDHTMS
jgi:hypothetical protein